MVGGDFALAMGVKQLQSGVHNPVFGFYSHSLGFRTQSNFQKTAFLFVVFVVVTKSITNIAL